MSSSFNQIQKLRSIFAPSQLEVLDIPNKNYKLLKDLLDRKLKPSDKGIEVGSSNYISKSSHYFIRAKALQSHSFLPFWNNEEKVPISPSSYINYSLKKGDIILSKDSNIGEIIILDKDYPNHMISGALYKLPLTNLKYYILAFIKHDYFRKQLNLLVPKGSTIRHAKTLFLDCKIPFPTQKDKKEIIEYVETLTKIIIKIENEINSKSNKIHDLIDEELKQNCKKNFNFENSKFSDLISKKRLDTGMYNEEFKKNYFLIENYKYGSSTLKKLGYKITRGQNLQISNIGKSIYSKNKKDNFYSLLLSKNITENMVIKNYLYLGNSNKLKLIQKGDIVFSCRGNLGRVIIFCEDLSKTITNIDNVHIINKKEILKNKIFLGCFLNYLKKQDILSMIAITGSGAESFTKYHFDILKIPLFKKELIDKISKLYYDNVRVPEIQRLDKFSDEYLTYIKSVGIHELDMSLRKIKVKLNDLLNDITVDKKIKINFSFLTN